MERNGKRFYKFEISQYLYKPFISLRGQGPLVSNMASSFSLHSLHWQVVTYGLVNRRGSVVEGHYITLHFKRGCRVCYETIPNLIIVIILKTLRKKTSGFILHVLALCLFVAMVSSRVDKSFC